MSVKCELFFFILDARGDLHTTMHVLKSITIPPASKIRRLIYAAPNSVQASLLDKRCLLKQLSERGWRARGYPLTQGTRTKDLPVPLPRSPDGTEGLYLLDDVTTSANKRVLAITCSAILSILNQMHKVIYIDCTFKIVWRTEDLISIICFFVGTFLERSGAKNVKFNTFLFSHYNIK